MEQVKLPFRADIVGSFLRPERLKKARKDFESGLLSPAALQQIEDEEIEKFKRKLKTPAGCVGRILQIKTGQKEIRTLCRLPHTPAFIPGVLTVQ